MMRTNTAFPIGSRVYLKTFPSVKATITKYHWDGYSFISTDGATSGQAVWYDDEFVLIELPTNRGLMSHLKRD
jgi:hypothetical protein